MTRSQPFKLTHLFTRPVQLLGSATRKLAVSGRSQRVRPSLEALEDRFMPAVRIWDGGAVSNNWTNAKNWAGDIAPVAGDDLVFPSNAPDKTSDNNFNNGTLFNSLTLAGGYTLRGNQILLGAGGIIVTGSTSNIIKTKLDLGSGAARAFQIGTGSTLFIDDKISGSAQLHKTGAGDLSFRDNNTYTGVTDIKAGRLFIEKDESLGTFNASANTIIRGGAQLLINDQAIGTIRSDEPITIENGGSIRAINDVNLRGNILLNGTATLQHDGGLLERLLITGQISGPGGITIGTGTGHVRFQGTSANTYQGLTTVIGKLRLDNLGGSAIAGDINITSTGVIRLENGGQIGDAATVTVQGGGSLLTNEKDDTFHKLKLVGGVVSGDKLRLNDFIPPLIVNFFGSFINNTPIIKNFAPDRESELTIDEFEATSASSTLSAQVVDVSIILKSIDGHIQVNDGPASNDLLLYGPVKSLGTDAAGDSILTQLGNGKTLLQDFPTDQYFVNGGELQFAKFQRDLISPDFFGVDVTVGSGAKFTGDVLLEKLLVKSGGRVHPGPLERPTLQSAILTQIVSGALSIGGDLVMEPGSILEVQLNNAVAGVGHELLNVVGSVTVDGAIIEAKVGPNVRVGQNYRVINNSGIDAINGLVAVPGPFLIAAPTGQKLSVNHAGGELNNDLVLTLQNTPPMAPDLELNRTTLNEGGFVTATGHLVDPDGRDQLRLLVNWGDGSEVETYEPGRSTFRLFHQYTDDGLYVPQFRWLDQHDTGNSRSFEVTVNNFAPRVELGDLHISKHHHSLFAHGIVTDAGNDFFSVTVDYGDGSPVVTSKLYHHKLFFLNHRYQQAGNYVLTVTATDKDGGVTTSERNVSV
ncbi:MAG TPA: PKD domain-containing protein [Gemmatales bacterium]|nr:PKD domain-containing protein [Gemmatales bacterium]